MPRIKRFAPKLTTNLTNIQTFLLDTVYESEYFRITEFKDTFTGGKNGFLIEGSEYLKESTEIKLEILDAAGNPIYYEVAKGNPQYYETTSILVAVYIYETTPVGPAKITILGEAKTYNDNGVVRNIPDEWQGVYNVKWERSFKVNRNLPNTDRVRFKYRPEIQVSEISGSVFLTQLTEVNQIGTVNGYPITPQVGTVLSNKYYGDVLYKVIKSGSGLNKKPAIDSPYWEGGNDWDSTPVFDFYLLEKCNPEEGDTNVYYLSNPTAVFGPDLLNPIIPYNQSLNLKIGDDIPQTYLLRGYMKLNQYDEGVLVPVTSTGPIPSGDITSTTYPYVYGCSGELSPGYLPPPTINSTNTTTGTDDTITISNVVISVYTQVENIGGTDNITVYATIVPAVTEEVIINTSVVYSTPLGGIASTGIQITVPPSTVQANSSPFDTFLTSITIDSTCLESHTFIENANVTVTNACGGYIPQPTIPIPNPTTPPTEPEDVDDGGTFPGQTILGATITIPSASIYDEPIFQFLNETELIIKKPYLENGIVEEFNQFNYSLKYNIISNFATSSLASSYGNFRINNLNTYVGDVKRVKIFYKPTRDITQYELLDDVKIESTELLKEEFSGSFVEYGNFTASYVDYWVTSSNINYAVSTSNATVFAGLSVETLSPTTASFSIMTSESFSLNRDEEYTFYTNIKYTGELGDDVYFKVYLSGSSIYSGSVQDIVTLNPVPQNLNQQRLEQNVIIREDGDYRLVIETYGDRWDFGGISFKSSQEEYFSPDYIEVNIPISRKRPQEYFDFKFEFYDINNNYIPADIFVNKVLFKEGKTVLPISSDDLSGLVDELIDEINDLKAEIANKPVYKYGEILFGTGTTIISQSANLYWDIPNERLGIHRKDPQYTVDVSGSVGITNNLIVSGSTRFGDNSVDTHIFTGSIDLLGDESIDGNLYVNEFPIYQESLHDAFTGLINGGVITIDGTNGQVFRISSGSGYIINNYTDSLNPTYQYITWPNLAITASAFPGPGQIATYPRTNIAIDSSGNVYEKPTKFTPQDYRNYIVLGRVVHVNNSVITRTLSLPLTTYNRGFHWFDLANSISPINVAGNKYSAGANDLTIQKSAGQTYRIGSNYKNNPAFPDITTDDISNPTSFRYRFRSGSGSEFIEQGLTTQITGSLYDDGSGTLQIVNNNQWTIQRIFFFGATATTIIQYGQNVYNSRTDAEAAAFTEPFEVDENLSDDSILRAYLLIRGGAADLSNLADAEFLEAVAGGMGSGGGGSGATTLESLTDVSYPTTLIPGQTIVYNGTDWVNGYPSTASFASTASYVNPLVQNVVITGSVNISGSITASLAPGNIWIGDENGQNIQVSTASILPTVSGVSPISVSYDSGTRNYQVSHTQSGVTPGTYNSVTVDIYGHITSGSVDLTGHIIQDSGSDMPQEENLNFVRMIVEDDSVNNATIVKRPPSVTVSGSAPTKDILEGDEWINDETWKKYVRYDDFWVETGKVDCTTTLVTISGSSADTSFKELTTLQLSASLANATLVEGSNYLITDFRTIHRILNTTDINTGPVEPMFALATSSGSLSRDAKSMIYPQDEIQIDWTSRFAEDGTTIRAGNITYRKDTVRNVSAYYDYRHVKWRRWVFNGFDWETGFVATTTTNITLTLVWSANLPASLTTYNKWEIKFPSGISHDAGPISLTITKGATSHTKQLVRKTTLQSDWTANELRSKVGPIIYSPQLDKFILMDEFNVGESQIGFALARIGTTYTVGNGLRVVPSASYFDVETFFYALATNSVNNVELGPGCVNNVFYGNYIYNFTMGGYSTNNTFVGNIASAHFGGESDNNIIHGGISWTTIEDEFETNVVWGSFNYANIEGYSINNTIIPPSYNFNAAETYIWNSTIFCNPWGVFFRGNSVESSFIGIGGSTRGDILFEKEIISSIVGWIPTADNLSIRRRLNSEYIHTLPSGSDTIERLNLKFLSNASGSITPIGIDSKGDVVAYTSSLTGSSTTVSIPNGEIGFGNELNQLTSSVELKWNNTTNILTVTGSVEIQGSVTASLQEGYMWVGDVNGVNIQIPTSSIISDGITINNNADTRILTANGTISSIDAESNLTFDNNILNVNGICVSRGGGNLISNTAIGSGSLSNNTTGINNTSVGNNSLYCNTTGNCNTALGSCALFSNTTGFDNTGIGNLALHNNSIGRWNTAIGSRTLYYNTTGGNNTAIGIEALRSSNFGSTSANANVAVGYRALCANTSGNRNVAIGTRALELNIYGGLNTALGSDALRLNNGSQNTAVGECALNSNTTGGANTAIGNRSLLNNTTGGRNTAIGVSTLCTNTSGRSNIAVGNYALRNNTIGTGNIAVGTSALYANTTASCNVAVGYRALSCNTGGCANTAIGFCALRVNTIGNCNVAVGEDTLRYNTSGGCNVAVGNRALSFNTIGMYNTAIGRSALFSNTTGNYNVAIGVLSLSSNTTGICNISVGYGAGGNINTGVNNILAVGTHSCTSLNSNHTRWGNASHVCHCINGTWTNVSDCRDKTNIRPLSPNMGLAFINKLNPVSFNFDYRENYVDKCGFEYGVKDGTLANERENYGLIAQELKEVLDNINEKFDALGYTEEHDAYRLAYEELIPSIIKSIQELKSEIDMIKNRMQ